jgi:hypothetical protein
MKNPKCLIAISFLIPWFVAIAQAPTWETAIELPLPRSNFAATSDGYGQHVVATYSGSGSLDKVYYRLYGNDGVLLRSQVFEPIANANVSFATIASLQWNSELGCRREPRRENCRSRSEAIQSRFHS